eukprot:scaffold36117_cov35-Prasinocladus_malaysianus.AAC.2
MAIGYRLIPFPNTVRRAEGWLAVRYIAQAGKLKPRSFQTSTSGRNADAILTCMWLSTSLTS